jgi:hypothetical protein
MLEHDLEYRRQVALWLVGVLSWETRLLFIHFECL